MFILVVFVLYPFIVKFPFNNIGMSSALIIIPSLAEPVVTKLMRAAVKLILDNGDIVTVFPAILVYILFKIVERLLTSKLPSPLTEVIPEPVILVLLLFIAVISPTKVVVLNVLSFFLIKPKSVSVASWFTPNESHDSPFHP